VAEDRNRRGTAMLEFAISLPFLILMLTAISDLAVMLHEYTLISQAVHAGVRAATESTALPSGTYRLVGSAPACPITGSSVVLQELQERVGDIVRLNNTHVDFSTLCITTEVRTAALWSGTPQENTVLMQVRIGYRSFFPLFRDASISVEASGPYLS
jgi:hypothetical protein